MSSARRGTWPHGSWTARMSASRASAASVTLSKSITSPPYSMLRVPTRKETEAASDEEAEELDEVVQAVNAARATIGASRRFIAPQRSASLRARGNRRAVSEVLARVGPVIAKEERTMRQTTTVGRGPHPGRHPIRRARRRTVRRALLPAARGADARGARRARARARHRPDAPVRASRAGSIGTNARSGLPRRLVGRRARQAPRGPGRATGRSRTLLGSPHFLSAPPRVGGPSRPEEVNVEGVRMHAHPAR